LENMTIIYFKFQQIESEGKNDLREKEGCDWS
jgi:hypothetical protein